MNVNAARPGRAAKRDRVAHIRLAQDEIAALEVAAKKAGLCLSAFIRSLSLEGAGVRPFMTNQDRVILRMLGRDMSVIAANLNLISRAIRCNERVDRSTIAGAIDDARAIATTVVAEVTSMTRRAGADRRGDGS